MAEHFAEKLEAARSLAGLTGLNGSVQGLAAQRALQS